MRGTESEESQNQYQPEMGSLAEVVKQKQKPHAVMVPFPAQGHVTPMTKLAKILHSKGFFITFVNTEFNHKRLIRSRGPDSVHGLPDFRYATIPDGLPPSDADATQDVTSLCYSTRHTCLDPFLELMGSINKSASLGLVPPVTCIVSDGMMTFSVKAAHTLGIPSVLFWTASACGLVGYSRYSYLLNHGIIPLKEESYLTNGYLETKVEWLPGGMEHMRLRDIPSFIRTTDPQDILLNFFLGEIKDGHEASIILINTFHEFEKSCLNYLSSIYSAPIFTVGTLSLLLGQIENKNLSSTIDCNLWKEDSSCLRWLDSHAPSSVLYVNYGSITTLTSGQFTEFAWGLAASKHPFLWVIRPDLQVEGGSVVLSSEFKKETEGRGMIVSWCSQEDVLNHPAVGGFLTHCGWNSTVESVSTGKPMVCWPFFAEQQTNCRYACTEWGIGVELGPEVEREEVRKVVMEVLEGEKGKQMREKALEWKTKAQEATTSGGSSHHNLDAAIHMLLNNVTLIP